MSKANKIEWSNIEGALPKAKRLHLEKDKADSLYHCPHNCANMKANAGAANTSTTSIVGSFFLFFFFDQKSRVDLKPSANSSKAKLATNLRFSFLEVAAVTRKIVPLNRLSIDA